MGLKLFKTCKPPPPTTLAHHPPSPISESFLVVCTTTHQSFIVAGWINGIGTDFLSADSIALCITEHYYLPADRNLDYLSSTSISSLMLYSLSKTGIKFPKEK